MSIPVKVGEPVRLFLQMEDGEASLPVVVKATLRNESGTFLQELVLTHTGLGLFKNNSFILTSEKEVVVQYRIFDVDGTTLHPDFVMSANRFVLNDGVSGSGGSNGIIVGNEFVIEVDDG